MRSTEQLIADCRENAKALLVAFGDECGVAHLLNEVAEKLEGDCNEVRG